MLYKKGGRGRDLKTESTRFEDIKVVSQQKKEGISDF